MCFASALFRCSFYCLEFGTAGAEKFNKHDATFFSENPFGDLGAVVERCVVHDGEDGTTGTRLWIACGEDEAANACMENRSGAHGAGFKRTEERASEQTIVVERKASGTEGDNFSVGRGIVGAQNLVVAGPDNFAGGRGDDGADWNFARSLRSVGLVERKAHIVGIVQHVKQYRRRVMKNRKAPRQAGLFCTGRKLRLTLQCCKAAICDFAVQIYLVNSDDPGILVSSSWIRFCARLALSMAM
jgi:hypothetical protein